MKIKILFLAANPQDISRLRLDEEMRAIDTAIRQADYRDRYIIQSHWAVRVEDLQELFLRHQPDIVHFSGHGTAASEIILQDAAGQSVPVPSAALSDLFRLFKENISCVVLNACYSIGQAQAIAQHIPVVIGMSDAIVDDASINFAAAFYRALGYGRPVKSAFELGCNQIELTGLAEAEKPQLVTQRADPDQLTIPANPLHASDHHLWALLTIIPLTILAYYLFQMLYRWLYVDLEFLTFVVNLVQIIAVGLTLLGISTEWGQEAVRTLCGRLVSRFPRLRHTRLAFFAVVGMTLATALIFYSASPLLASQANAQGVAALEQGEYSTALQAFRRTVRIAPRTGRYHYNLGFTYATAGNAADAIREYQAALEYDDSFWPTYNNLGQLLLTAQNDPTGALQVLQPGLALVQRMTQEGALEPNQALLAQGVLHKNIGWARLVAGLPREALTQLQQAEKRLLALNDPFYLTETYRLTALAYEALGEAAPAQRAWGKVEGYGLIIPATAACTDNVWLTNVFCADAQNWVAEAREKLYSSPGEEK